MNKTSNYTSSSTFKLFNNKNNKSKLDTTTNNGNNASMIKKEIKQQGNQYSQLQSARPRTQSVQKKESVSKEKQQPLKHLDPQKRLVTNPNSSAERAINKQRTLSTSSRTSTLSPQSRVKPLATKNNTQQQQQQQQLNNSNQQPTPRSVKKQMFTSSNVKESKLNGNIISKMKPNYEKGKSLPFKKESPAIKLHKQDSNTISLQSIQTRSSKQSLSVHKSITINKMDLFQRSKTPQNKNLPNDPFYCIVRPMFKDAKYYQTSLIHYHYEQVRNKYSPYNIHFELEYSTKELKEYFNDLFCEHFQQSFTCLQYCKRLTQTLKQNNKIQQLPPIVNHTKTLVFDLDETLLHCNENVNDPTDYTIMVNMPNEGMVKTKINVRPYCQQMLKLLSNHFELILFTAAYQYYADKALELIDPDRKLFQYRFYRESCLEIEEGLFIKDLRVIGNRQIENLLLIDNAPYSYCYQIDNGIPIIPFYDNKYDKELVFLTDYLLNLEKGKQWTYANKVHFRTYLYQQSHTAEECLKEMFKAYDILTY
ncbi:unnamed protein product [Paramecium pentaurelia]|uniref:Mitochondrial import inner membrane translocase subunit TIM50 n=1 Tax=Paramecium pentaurelia TaxID=43138 RepID=A0A8S1SGF4_9CILI|nr:unnamed protein product [Paramecium pentaurelia]